MCDKKDQSGSSSSSEGSSDEECCNLPPAEKRLRKKWKCHVIKRKIVVGTLPPWLGGPCWTPVCHGKSRCRACGCHRFSCRCHRPCC